MSFDTDVLIIGGGVVGLAIGRELASAGFSTAILEKNPRYGLETSSRNSEVIHSGIHYRPGSLKARLCVEGNILLHEFCARNNLPVARPGKLTVATKPEEHAHLENLLRQGRENGVPDLVLMEGKEVARLEPSVSAYSALLSPSTGILNAHLVMDSFAKEFKEQGGMIAMGQEVTAIERINGGYCVIVGTTATERYRSRMVINSAGLRCDRIAAMTGIRNDLHWAKGDYFSTSQKFPIRRLVYPVPHTNALGIHLTPTFAGSFRFGPDIEYVEKKEMPYPSGESAADYRVDEGKADLFFDDVRSYLPSLRRDLLVPEMFGIRPKLQGPGDGFTDFLIRHETENGLPGFINLIGIESPGLTASPAIARYVKNIILDTIG